MIRSAILAAVSLAISIGATGTAQAQSVAEFYAGKSISLVVSTGVGGGLDTSARLVARHMSAHIPGKPSIVVRNMTGAGHLQATNYLYGQAPKDGTTIAAILPSFVGYQILDGRGIQYDAKQFNWIGASDVDNQNLYVWSKSGVTSVADAQKREILMGATGSGSYTVLWPTVMNTLLGTKFKIVTGYKSTNEIHLAMQRDEVVGRAGNFFSSLRSQNGDWLRDKSITILVQIGSVRDPDFPDVPLLTELALDQASRDILALLSGEVALGKAFLTTPELPADRLAALRAAFEATTRDPAYLAEARKSDIGTRAAGHAELKALADGMLATPPDLVVRAKAAIGLPQ